MLHHIQKSIWCTWNSITCHVISHRTNCSSFTKFSITKLRKKNNFQIKKCHMMHNITSLMWFENEHKNQSLWQDVRNFSKNKNYWKKINQKLCDKKNHVGNTCGIQRTFFSVVSNEIFISWLNTVSKITCCLKRISLNRQKSNLHNVQIYTNKNKSFRVFKTVFFSLLNRK